MKHVCPWWAAYLFDNRLRRLFNKPEEMFADYVKKGMTVMDVGCGMGFNSIGLAKMVGETGRVIAVDVQQEMLDVLKKRAKKANVLERISFHNCKPDFIDVNEAVDFVNAFWMLHEVPDISSFLHQISLIVKDGGLIFIAEPRLHVSLESFEKTLTIAQDAGLRLIKRPNVSLSRAAVFEKGHR